MPTNNPTPPTPPQGYGLVPRDSSVPSFIRNSVGPVNQSVRPLKEQQIQDTKNSETVAESKPGYIAIYHPELYTPTIRNHEMMHKFQATRSDGSIGKMGGYELQTPWGTSSSAPMKYKTGSPKNYDYGGQAGLLAMRNSGKTAADLNQEQQADVVADYKASQDAYLAKVKAGTATPADLRAMYQNHQVFHPFIREMANVPNSLSNSLPSIGTILGIGKPQPLAPAPAAPGLPSYDTKGLGVAPADPLMGGYSQPIRSVGARKKFKNDKIGVWDGHGWVQQQ